MKLLKVRSEVFQLIGQLEGLELCTEARLSIAHQLREMLCDAQELSPPQESLTR